MDVKLLTEEERARLRALEGLFEHPGWKVLLAEADEQIKYHEKQLEYVDDIKDHRYIRGTLDTLRGIRSYEDRVMQSFEATIRSRQEEEFEIDDSFGANE